MPQSPQTKRANARRRNDEKRSKIMRLARSGMNLGEISRILEADGDPTSRSRVCQILKQGLKEAAEERRHIALELFDMELDRLTWIIQQCSRIVNEPCWSCNGEGVFNNGDRCDICRGDGKINHPDTRLRAMKEIRSAVHQRSQMLGMYAPEKFALTDSSGNDIRLGASKEIESMSMEDLDRSINDFQAGIEAARALRSG